MVGCFHPGQDVQDAWVVESMWCASGHNASGSEVGSVFANRCSKYGYGVQSILLCGEYYASARGLRCTLSEEELCRRRAHW